MRAIVLPEYGPATALTLRTLPDPTPGPGEVVVRMAGASINPIDWKQRGGAYHAYMPLTFPAVFGRDVSGTVVAVGAGVTSPAVGARVLGRVAGGAYAELVVAPADRLRRRPREAGARGRGRAAAGPAHRRPARRGGGRRARRRGHPGHGRHRQRRAGGGVRGEGARGEGDRGGARQAPGGGGEAGRRRRSSRSTTTRASPPSPRSTASPTPSAGRRRRSCSPSSNRAARSAASSGRRRGPRSRDSW